MYKDLAHELDRPNPDILKILTLLVNGRPKNFFDKMFNEIFYDPRLGIFTLSQENNFFHLLAQKGILSPTLYAIDRDKDKILRREYASPDDLYLNLNAINYEGLTPAHIAVKNDPVALWWLMKFKVALTSKDYAANVLSFYTNNPKINNKSPLEYIFDDDKTAKNVVLKMLESGNWEFFDLFKDEIPIVQEKFKKYLKHIPNEAQRFQSGVAINAFGILFQSYWKDILVDQPESLKIERLMNVLDGKIQDIALSIEDLSKLLTRKDLVSTEKIKAHILARCSWLYLNKFSTTNISSLKDAPLELIIGSAEFGTIKFQAIKRYVEDLPNNSIVDDPINPTAKEMILEKLEEGTMKQDDQDSTSKSDPVTINGISMKEVNSIEDKKSINSYENHTPECTSKITKKFIDFKPEVETEVDIETFAQEMFNIFKKDEDCAKKIKEEEYSQLHALICFSFDKESFNDLFNDVVNDFESHKNLKVPFKDVSSFFEKYIKLLPQESLPANSKTKTSGHDALHKIYELARNVKPEVSKYNEGRKAYELACKAKNDQVAKLLAQRGIELKLCTEEANFLFEFAFKYKCRETIKFLLFEASSEFKDSFKIGWGYVLHQTLKYTDIETANDYVNFNFDIVEDTTNKRSEPCEDGEYTVLNKGLSILKQLSRSLIKYDNAVVSNQKKIFYQSKINSIEKIPELCKILELLIEKEKLYYGAENQHIAAKTYTLLNGIKSYISKISESLNKIVMGIENELDGDYCDRIKKALKLVSKKLLKDSCQDEIKEALSFLNKSILDEKYHDEVQEALKFLDRNVLNGEYGDEVKKTLKSLNKNVLDRNHRDRIEEALNSMDNLHLLVIDRYPSHKLNPHQIGMFEKLKLGEIDYAPSLAGTSNPDVSLCSESQLSDYEPSGDTDSVYDT